MHLNQLFYSEILSINFFVIGKNLLTNLVKPNPNELLPGDIYGSKKVVVKT